MSEPDQPGHASKAGGETPELVRAVPQESVTSEATWRGGPWDGVTMTVIAGERFFPLYGTATLSGGITHDLTPLTRRRAQPRRLCPVLVGPNGLLVIDWHAGTLHL